MSFIDSLKKRLFPKVPVADGFKVIQVMHNDEVAKALAAVSPNLSDVKVTTINPLAPEIVRLEGALNIYGDIHVWSVEVDLRGLLKAEDVIQLAGALEASFEKAAATLSRPAA